MKVYFKDLQAKHNITIDHIEVDVNELMSSRADIIRVDPVSMSSELHLSGETVIVQGSGQAQARFVCARCLREFEQAVSVQFSEAFSQSEDVVAADEEGDIELINEEYIDLLPLIEEHIVISFPFAPLCAEHCKGLCAMCGQDLNEQQCSCAEEMIDPRLEGLKAFFD